MTIVQIHHQMVNCINRLVTWLPLLVMIMLLLLAVLVGAGS